jgi:hypothetical protein
LPKAYGLPLSRFSRAELRRFVVEQAVSQASASTIGRWLAEDAIKPWQHRSSTLPSDPNFLQKAGPILDLYEGRWDGKLLEPGDCVISADAKPSIQARKRIHSSAPPAPGHGQLVEHEYERKGALTYLDAWDVRRGKVMGRSERKGGNRDRAPRRSRRLAAQRADRLSDPYRESQGVPATPQQRDRTSGGDH